MIFVSVLTNTFGQPTLFKTYKDTAHKISFDIPAYWKIIFSKDQGKLICIPATKARSKLYEDCFDGIVFAIDFENYGIDSLLHQFDKVDNNYFTSDRIRHDVPIKFIKGKDWKGVRHDNICGIDCRGNGFHAGAGECQFFYFCKANMTVEIGTFGRALDEKIITRLITSFKFTD
jgi:hypothetical protein